MKTKSMKDEDINTNSLIGLNFRVCDNCYTLLLDRHAKLP